MTHSTQPYSLLAIATCAAAALAAITAGSADAEDIVYSIEDFEGGTPNYTITGDPPVLTVLQAGDPLANITAHTALSGTDYVAGSPTSMGVVAQGLPFAAAGEPTGQHGFVGSSSNRNMTLASPMTLLDDNAQSLTVSFAYMVHGIGTVDFIHTLELTYSASGDFTDAVKIATFATDNALTLPNPPPASVLGHTTVAQDVWTAGNLSITPSETLIFTDTAKIRFNKMAPSGPTQYIFLDNIVIKGTPGPATPAPFTATIKPAVNPTTGYDIQWPSQTGASYTLYTNTDLAAPIDSWTVVAAAIAPTPPQNTYNVPANGPRRFYAVKEVSNP